MYGKVLNLNYVLKFLQELLLESFLPWHLPVVYAVVFVLSVFFTNQEEDKFLVDKVSFF